MGVYGVTSPVSNLMYIGYIYLQTGKCQLLRDYKNVARQAKGWSVDQQLSPNKRLLAQSLCDLAELLSDANFGCPTEHLAAEEMYCHLCKSSAGLLHPASQPCPKGDNCPHVIEKGHVH